MKIFLLFLFTLSYIFANTLSEIKNSGLIRIGVDIDQAPFSKLVDGSFEGFEIDLAKALLQNIFTESEIKIEFIPTNFEDGISDLQNNKIDIFIDEMTITDERLKLVNFSIPYFAVNIGILTNKEDKINNLTDLRDQTIIAFKDSTAEKFLKEKGFNLTYCKTAADGYKMLKNGEGKAFADDNLMVMTFPVVDNLVEVNIKNLGKTDFLGVTVQKIMMT